MKWEGAFCGGGGGLWKQGPCDVKCVELLLVLDDVGRGPSLEVGGCHGAGWTTYLQRRGTNASSSMSVTLPGVCVCARARACWRPKQWLFLPELGVRRHLCLLSCTHGAWTWVRGSLARSGPVRCCHLWQNQGSGR